MGYLAFHAGSQFRRGHRHVRSSAIADTGANAARIGTPRLWRNKRLASQGTRMNCWLQCIWRPGTRRNHFFINWIHNAFIGLGALVVRVWQSGNDSTAYKGFVLKYARATRARDSGVRIFEVLIAVSCDTGSICRRDGSFLIKRINGKTGLLSWPYV